ncbi:MAG: MOSC domain-containing protein [Chloroflexota bacterium]
MLLTTTDLPFPPAVYNQVQTSGKETITMMKLISVNIGQARPINNGKVKSESGIFKMPAAGPVEITVNGIENDAIVDVKHHGGPDQAIYVYGGSDYAWWSAELGTELDPGTFGDNLTISGLESAQYSIGDRLQIGNVILEVTAPRIPCGTLAARMGDRGFIKRFRKAERPGLYCRVIQPGTVQAGEAVTYQPYQGETVTILEMFRDAYEQSLSAETLQRYLAAPIAIRDRKHKEKQLQKLVASGS